MPQVLEQLIERLKRRWWVILKVMPQFLEQLIEWLKRRRWVILEVVVILAIILYRADRSILGCASRFRLDDIYLTPSETADNIVIQYPERLFSTPQASDNIIDLQYARKFHLDATQFVTIEHASECEQALIPPLAGNTYHFIVWSPPHHVDFTTEAGGTSFVLSLAPHTQTSLTATMNYIPQPNNNRVITLCFAYLDPQGKPLPLYRYQEPSGYNTLLLTHKQMTLCSILNTLSSPNIALFAPLVLGLLQVASAWYLKEQERKQRDKENKRHSLRERVENFIDKKEHHWASLWNLWQQILSYEEYENLESMLTDILQNLKNAPAFQFEVHQWLGERLANSCPDRELDMLVKLHFLDEQQPIDLCDARKRLQSPEASHKERAEAALTILHNLGLAGLPYIEEQLKGQSNERQGPNPNPYREVWEKDAIGRYLWVRLTQNKSIYTGEDLTQPLRGLCSLWPIELAQEITSPFGPPKAEDDPRLATRELFWDGHPAWEKAARYGHSGFLVPQGGGLSAMILQGRRTFTLYGSSTALSVYLLIDASVKVKTEEDWLKHLHRAIAESLLCALATDPVWFLAADEAGGRGSTWQRELVAFLQLYSSDQNSTEQGFEGLRTLLERGFPDPMPQAGRLLLERLSTLVVDTPPHLSWPLLYNVVKGSQQRLALYAMDDKSVPLFFWIEVQIQKAQQRHTVARWLWNNRQLRDLGYIKLFVAIDETDEDEEEEAKAYDGDFTLLRWTAEQLQALLDYRIRQVGRSADKRHFISISDFQRWLVQQGLAPRTPQAYIRAGNRWLETR